MFNLIYLFHSVIKFLYKLLHCKIFPLSIGKYYYRKENYDKAGLYFDKALKLNDQNAMAYYLKGRVNHVRGMFNEAVDNYTKAINIDRELGDAYLYRGAIKVKQKFRGSACNDFKMAQSLNVKEAEEALRKYCK